MARRRRVAYVGDSMGVGTVPYLKDQARVRADVLGGRGSADGVDALKQILKGKDFDRVVFDLGTNDWTARDLKQSLKRARRLAGDAQLVALTVNGRKAAQKNALLKRWENKGKLDLVDWADRTGLISSDGIHATGEGYDKRADLIAQEFTGGTQAPQSSQPRDTTAPSPASPAGGLDQLLASLKRPQRASGTMTWTPFFLE